MSKIFSALVMFFGIFGVASAMNDTARVVRNCEGLYVGTSDNYVLKCNKTEQIAKIMDTDGMRQFFAADNDGDIRGTFLGNIPDDDNYVYVNVATNMRDARYENQTCYRFITEKDTKRDGFYAVEICEYERPDSYL